MTLENGKPLTQSQGEVAMTVDHLGWFAEEARRGYGRIVPNQVEGKRHLVVKTPIGVIGSDQSVEFSAGFGGAKNCAGAGCRLHGRFEAGQQNTGLLGRFCRVRGCRAASERSFSVGRRFSVRNRQRILDNPLCRKITFTGSTEVGNS